MMRKSEARRQRMPRATEVVLFEAGRDQQLPETGRAGTCMWATELGASTAAFACSKWNGRQEILVYAVNLRNSESRRADTHGST
jgi:hypothetical protein